MCSRRPCVPPRTRAFVGATRTKSAAQAASPSVAGSHASSLSSVFSFDSDDVDFARDQSFEDFPTARAFTKVKCLSFIEFASFSAKADPTSQVRRLVHEALEAADGMLDVEELAAILQAEGLPATAVPHARAPLINLGGSTQQLQDASGILPGASNSYIVVRSITGAADDDIIVEPSMRAAFSLGGATTPHFERKLAATPAVFVGTRAQLQLAVADLATAISLNFTALGLPVPLWRSRKNLLARWHLRGGRQAGASPAHSTSGAASEAGSSAASDSAMLSLDELIVAAINDAALKTKAKAQADPLSRRASEASSEASDDGLAESPDTVLYMQGATGAAPAAPAGKAIAAADAVKAGPQPKKVVYGFAV